MESQQAEVLQPLTGDTFKFACHPGVPCFTECCRDLNLILTPYDILRLKKRLDVASQSFLKTYTQTEIRDSSVLPAVLLKMKNDERKICPFVTKEGCLVYEDRPGACRTYPLGRAASKAQGQKQASEKYFMVRENHCRGFEQDKTWTVEQWLNHEGLHEYNLCNDPWMEIVTICRQLPRKDLDQKKLGMFFLASYNLDDFRRFVFESSFLDRFQVSREEVLSIRKDDLALMKFAIMWIKFFLLGQATLKFRSR